MKSSLLTDRFSELARRLAIHIAEKGNAWFIFSAGGILMFIGLAEIIGIFGATQVLSLNDLILDIPVRSLMLAMGLTSLSVSVLCLFTKKRHLCRLLIIWLATNFLVYLGGLWWQGCHHSWG